MTKVTLSPLTDAPAFDYSRKFQLPADCLRVVSVGDIDEYRINGRTILSDETAIDLTYIYRVSDPTELDVLCADAISAYMAWDICFKVTQSLNLKTSLWQEYQTILRVAKNIDSKEEPAGSLHASFFIDSRDADQSLPRVTR